jgi:hypothetical protein
MPAKNIVPLIDTLDLEANPRSSKLGPVTDAIQKSLCEDEGNKEKLFPFKSKGILLASSTYKELDRDRFELEFDDLSTEGILDGGHNTLAVGSYILCQAELSLGKPEPKKREMQIWDDFKTTWQASRGDIELYLDQIREEKSDLLDAGVSVLDFVIPVELLVPSNADDEFCVTRFKTSLLEICDARNNNAQLTQGTKANQEGLYDSFRRLFEEKDPDFAKTISWKTNDGGKIQSRSLVALAWVPLSLTSWVSSDDAIVDAPSPVSIYSGKEKCLDRYIDLMRDEHISNGSDLPVRELKDTQVESALKVAVDMPALFDKIYRLFPTYYSGSYGKINAVKGLMNKRGQYVTPFFGWDTERPVPDGFIYPLVYGLKAIMRRNGDTGMVEWCTDPYEFVEGPEFRGAVAQYSGVIQQSDYDPQKVGKGAFSYTAAENAIKLAYLSSSMQ